MKKKTDDEYFNVDDLKRFMSLSAREKLEYMEQFSSFLAKAMPKKSKRIWNELKRRGF